MNKTKSWRDLPQMVYPNGFWHHFGNNIPPCMLNFYRHANTHGIHLLQLLEENNAILFQPEKYDSIYVAFINPMDYTAFMLRWS